MYQYDLLQAYKIGCKQACNHRLHVYIIIYHIKFSFVFTLYHVFIRVNYSDRCIWYLFLPDLLINSTGEVLGGFVCLDTESNLYAAPRERNRHWAHPSEESSHPEATLCQLATILLLLILQWYESRSHSLTMLVWRLQHVSDRKRNVSCPAQSGSSDVIVGVKLFYLCTNTMAVYTYSAGIDLRLQILTSNLKVNPIITFLVRINILKKAVDP